MMKQSVSNPVISIYRFIIANRLLVGEIEPVRE
jgi:hypothetical protein